VDVLSSCFPLVFTLFCIAIRQAASISCGGFPGDENNVANFQKPKRIESDRDSLSDTYGRFIAEPFERGFGVTIGNALRRVLLSSLTGAAVTTVKIQGSTTIFHYFLVLEDTTEIILNLKELLLKMHVEKPKQLFLEVSGPSEVLRSIYH